MEVVLAAVELGFTWVLNGLLVILYVMLERIPALLIIPAMTWLTADIEDERRPWMMAASGLSLVAALFAPVVVGAWLNLMAYGSMIAIKVEKFNRSTLRWRVVNGLTAYALIGLGFLIYQALKAWIDYFLDEMQAQGTTSLVRLQKEANQISTSLGLLVFEIGRMAQTAIRGPKLDPNKFHLADFDVQQDQEGNPTKITCPHGQGDIRKNLNFTAHLGKRHKTPTTPRHFRAG